MKKIFFVILIIALAGGGYYLWQNRYKYFFQGEQLEINESEREEGGQKNPDGQSNANNGNQTDSNKDTRNSGFGVRASVEISSHDCDEQCENRKGTDSYKYCLEVCGLSSLTDGLDQNENCDSLADFDRDVCFKNKAIKEKNDSACKEISDEQLRESCINRVLEEIL